MEREIQKLKQNLFLSQTENISLHKIAAQFEVCKAAHKKTLEAHKKCNKKLDTSRKTRELSEFVRMKNFVRSIKSLDLK